MNPFGPPPVYRIRIPARDGGDPRPHPRHPHPPSVVAAVRDLVENTRLPFRTIAHRTGVNSGTVSRWAERHGWTRPPGAAAFLRRPEDRYKPVIVGRVLATRLRVQAERLVAAIEAAPSVEPAALAEALDLLARAREEQAVRRSRRLRPPTPTETAATLAAKAEAAAARDAERRREALARLAADRPPEPSWRPAAPPPYRWTWNRSESARMGWKARYARMRATGQTFKKDRRGG
jgi:hypothetical protein